MMSSELCNLCECASAFVQLGYVNISLLDIYIYMWVCARDWSAVCLVFIINLLNTFDSRTKTLHTSNASNTVYIWTVEVYKRKNKWLFREKRLDKSINNSFEHLKCATSIEHLCLLLIRQLWSYTLLYAFTYNQVCRQTLTYDRFKMTLVSNGTRRIDWYRKKQRRRKNPNQTIPSCYLSESLSVRFYPVIDRLCHFNLFFV